MDKNQFKLCKDVLGILRDNGILSKIILIGSWCVPLYEKYFADIKYYSIIKTRDIDFLIPKPSEIKDKIDITKIVKGLGFVVTHSYPQGFIKLSHPELIIEFLVPDKGRGLPQPYPLPQLGLNAQALRFMDLLSMNTINVEMNGIPVRVPHPVNFGLHKLIIADRRKEKGEKDIISATAILRALIAKGEAGKIKKTYDALPAKWQSMIRSSLEKQKESDILKILT